VRGVQEPAPLVGSDAGAWSTEGRVASEADLDEYQHVPITQDQVDLAEAAAVVRLQQFQPLPLQIGQRQAFGLCAASPRIRPGQGLSPVPDCPAARGTASPWRNWASTSSRAN
jgi:hypothetical protein